MGGLTSYITEFVLIQCILYGLLIKNIEIISSVDWSWAFWSIVKNISNKRTTTSSSSSSIRSISSSSCRSSYSNNNNNNNNNNNKSTKETLSKLYKVLYVPKRRWKIFEEEISSFTFSTDFSATSRICLGKSESKISTIWGKGKYLPSFLTDFPPNFSLR